MSARNRGRANPNQDADEERRLWKEIKDKAKDVDIMVVGHPLCNRATNDRPCETLSHHDIVYDPSLQTLLSSVPGAFERHRERDPGG